MRAKVSEDNLKQVVEDLRSSGMSNQDISDKINTRIDSCLYNDYSMPLKSFRKLENLYGSKIPHKKLKKSHGSSYIKYKLDISKDEELAELAGIILGDGHLQSKENNENRVNYLEITLHEDEQALQNKTSYLIKSKTDIEPKIYSKEGRCVRIVVHSRELISELQEKGFKPGNKKENQIEIPYWIKNNKKYSKYCIRGLIDTDGSIYQDKRNKRSYIRIQFSNHSEKLIKGFKKCCKLNGIRTVKGGNHQIQISRSDIDKFINKIKPIKSNRLKLLQK